MKTVAVIDDDIHIGNILEELLLQANYSVLRAYSGTEALLLLEHSRPDLVLLDLMMPGLSGEEVLSQLSGIPVIVVSAKVAIDDKVNLLQSGAVDYVTKPFNGRELMARVAVHLRDNTVSGPPPVFRSGTLSLDPVSHSVTVADIPVRLTRTEYAVLKLLMENPSQVVTKSALLDRISLDTPDCTESSLKTHMSNLRKKLRDSGAGDCIESVWGIGFKMRTE